MSFGQAQRYTAQARRCAPSSSRCRVRWCSSEESTEISYAVELEPRVVKSASARVVAPAGQELRAPGCNVFTPIKGGFSQTQLGSTLSRVDKEPLRSGQYTLRITVDGQTAECRSRSNELRRALLLDLDDTILDDSSLVHDSWREACAGHADRLRRSMRRPLSMPSGKPRSGSGTIPIGIAKAASSSRLRGARS